jgi:putative endonuclease
MPESNGPERAQRVEGPVRIRLARREFNNINISAMYFVYILRTLDNTLYTGVTECLEQRIGTHNRGKGAEWISAHPGAHLLYSEPHVTLGSARKREIQLKKWSEPRKKHLSLETSRA